MIILLDGGAAESAAPPFLSVAAQERARLLSDCLAELPLRWQAILAMRYGAGLTVRAVGMVLGVSAVAIWRSEQRALAAMRTHLAQRGVRRFDEV